MTTEKPKVKINLPSISDVSSEEGKNENKTLPSLHQRGFNNRKSNKKKRSQERRNTTKFRGAEEKV